MSNCLQHQTNTSLSVVDTVVAASDGHELRDHVVETRTQYYVLSRQDDRMAMLSIVTTLNHKIPLSRSRSSSSLSQATLALYSVFVACWHNYMFAMTTTKMP